MKVQILFFFILLFGLTASAQTTPASIPNKSDELLQKPEIREKVYCCQKCNYTDTKPGVCPVDKVKLIKEGTYYCPVCQTTSDTSCKCPKCGRSMKRMDTPTKEANNSTGKPNGK
jgi:hypothetical protein